MKHNQLRMGTFLSYITIFVNIILQLLYTPIMLKLLGQSEYGVYTLTASIISYLSLFSLGFSGAYVRFFSRYRVENDEKSIAKLNGTFLIVFCVLAVLAFLSGCFLVTNCETVLGNKITADEMHIAKVLMQVLICNISLTLINSVFSAITAANERYVFQRGLDLICKILNPFLALPLLLLGYGSIGLTCVTVVCTVINLFINIMYVLKRLQVKFLFKEMDFSLLKEIGVFSFWIFLNMIIDQVNWNVDKLILGRICGSLAVAVYGVGAQLNSVYMMFSNAISSVFGPKVNYLVAQGKSDMNLKLTELFVKVGRLQFMVLFFIASGLTLFGREFIALWAGKEYDMAYFVVLCLIWPGVISSSQSLGIEIQRAKNMHQFRSKLYFGMAIFNIIISIPLSIKFGEVGAALGTTNSIICANIIIMNLYYHKRIGIDMMEYWRNIVRFVPAMTITLLSGVLWNILFEVNTWPSLVIQVGIYSIFFWIVMWNLGMNKEEKKICIDLLNKISERKKGK